MNKKNVIVIGGGFAGLQFIKQIDTSLFNILLIDKLNHHQFQPLFYQVATSQLEPSSISFPFRKIFQNNRNVQIRMAEVLKIETLLNTVVTDIGNFEYNYLIIATGCSTNFFGNESIKENAFTLKTTYHAILIRNNILQNFENMLWVDEVEKEKLNNIVIVGGGPTGVELAGAFAEIKKNILPKDYPGINFKHLNIYLIEGSNHTLNSMSKNAQQASQKYLSAMGVIVQTGLTVKNYDGQIVSLSNGTTIPSKSVIWAAGVIGNAIAGLNAECIAQGKRFIVDRYNCIAGYQNIFAIGDVAFMQTPKYTNGHPQVANVAINQAKNVAKNFKRKELGSSLIAFEYKDRGSMATIGKHKAVVDLSILKFKGYFAWVIWMFLHLMLILGVKNKLIIFINWAWSYVTKNTSLRLILSLKQKGKDDK